ncbi:MAG: hypothetical protein IT340_12530 [Chloroflexi bacterium]|nr:hypothetical protein [Chloroflexota bacterium]
MTMLALPRRLGRVATGRAGLPLSRLVRERTAQDRRREQAEQGWQAAYAAALVAGRLIGGRFPELYARQVRWRRLTLPVCFALLELWLNLVEHHWWWLWACDCFEPAREPRQIEPIFVRRCASMTAAEAVGAFVDDGAPVRAFFNPLPVTFGLGRDGEAIAATCLDHGATVWTIWNLVQATGWQVHAIRAETGETDWLDGMLVDATAGAARPLGRRPRAWLNDAVLPRATDMAALADALAAAPLPTGGSIGALLRSVCGMHDDVFADLTVDEVLDDHGGFGEMDWDDDGQLTEWRDRQRRAATLHEQLSAYFAAVARRPRLLVALVETILTTAGRLAQERARPRGLIDILARERSAGDDGTGDPTPGDAGHRARVG